MKIEANHLTKQYKENYALKNLTFTLNEPIIYGLLGRNGAGKTTFMEILAGHIRSTSGSITVNNEDPFDNREAMRKICLIKEGDNFQKEMKIKEVLKLCAFFYPKWDVELASQLVDTFKLNRNAKVKTLSKGMSSALGIIVGLASKAPITIFDEPYIGLDAAARKKFYEILIVEYEAEPRMVIFSTHLIDEASQLFEEVLIFQDGALRLQEKAEHLREQTYAVSGPKDIVETYIADKQVMKRENLVGMSKVYIYGVQESVLPRGLSEEGVAMEEIMIYLTEKGEEL